MKADNSAIYRVQKLLIEYFAIAEAELVTRRSPRLEDSTFAESVFLLQLDQLLDRTQGFIPHLVRLFKEIFEPARGRFESELGFCPSDVMTIVRSQFVVANARVNEVMTLLAQSKPSVAQSADLSKLIGDTLLESQYLQIEAISEESGMDEPKIERIMDALALDWNCQPDFRSPGSKNLARTRPIVRTKGRYFCPLPWGLAHETLRWTHDLILERGLTSLMSTLDRRRSAATESLSRSSLASVFGSDHVWSKVHYNSGASVGEIDVLATYGDLVFIVEAKSHQLTERGRAGEIKRVERVTREAIEDGLGQLARAHRYLTGPLVELTDAKRNVLEIPMPESSQTVRLLISLERLDPLAFRAPELVGPAMDNEDAAVWAIGIVDLLLVVEVLSTPVEFSGYALFRQRFSAFSRDDTFHGVRSDDLFHQGRSFVSVEQDDAWIFGPSCAGLSLWRDQPTLYDG